MNKLLISKEIKDSIDIENEEIKKIEDIFGFLNVKVSSDKEEFFGTLHSITKSNTTVDKFSLNNIQFILSTNQLVKFLTVSKIKNISILYNNTTIENIDLNCCNYRLNVFSDKGTSVYIVKIDF